MQPTLRAQSAAFACDVIFRLQPSDMLAIGQRIRRVRKAAGLKQSALAQQLGMRQSGLSQVESGIVRPSLDLLVVLASQYGAPIDWVLRNNGQDPTAARRAKRR